MVKNRKIKEMKKDIAYLKVVFQQSLQDTAENSFT